MKNIFRLLPLATGCTLIAALSLSGCLSLKSKAPPAERYVIHAAGNVPLRTLNLPPDTVLSVRPPAVPSGYDNNRIALLLDGGRRLDYYANSNWPDHLDDMLYDVLVQTVQKTYAGMTVAGQDLRIPAQYELNTNILHFEPVYAADAAGTPDVYVAVRFTLVRLADGRVVDDFTLESHTKAAQNTLSSVTGQLETSLQGLFNQAFLQMHITPDPSPADKKKKPAL